MMFQEEEQTEPASPSGYEKISTQLDGIRITQAQQIAMSSHIIDEIMAIRMAQDEMRTEQAATTKRLGKLEARVAALELLRGNTFSLASLVVSVLAIIIALRGR